MLKHVSSIQYNGNNSVSSLNWWQRLTYIIGLMQVIFYIENKKLQRKLKMSTFQIFQKYMYLYLQWIQKKPYSSICT